MTSCPKTSLKRPSLTILTILAGLGGVVERVGIVGGSRGCVGRGLSAFASFEALASIYTCDSRRCGALIAV